MFMVSSPDTQHDLTKKRTIDVGLHGPWGETSSVFFRAKFTFPKDYPQAPHPIGTPTVELDRNPLISLKDRAFMLGRLRAIRQTQRPCLELCLRFLLFGDEGERIRRNSESSSDDESRVRSSTLQSLDEELPYALLRNDKNLAEPRTSQGVFGPNGKPHYLGPKIQFIKLFQANWSVSLEHPLGSFATLYMICLCLLRCGLTMDRNPCHAYSAHQLCCRTPSVNLTVLQMTVPRHTVLAGLKTTQTY